MPLSRKSWIAGLFYSQLNGFDCFDVPVCGQLSHLASVDSGKVDCAMSRSVSAVLDIWVAQFATATDAVGLLTRPTSKQRVLAILLLFTRDAAVVSPLHTLRQGCKRCGAAELQPFAILGDGVKTVCGCCLHPYENATALFFFAFCRQMPTIT